MNVVYCSYDGRYSDNPRALYEGWPRRSGDQHVWLSHPLHRRGFPRSVPTVTAGSAEARGEVVETGYPRNDVHGRALCPDLA